MQAAGCRESPGCRVLQRKRHGVVLNTLHPGAAQIQQNIAQQAQQATRKCSLLVPQDIPPTPAG